MEKEKMIKHTLYKLMYLYYTPPPLHVQRMAFNNEMLLVGGVVVRINYLFGVDEFLHLFTVYTI